LQEAVKAEYPETLGEFLDTMRVFGLTDADPLVHTGVRYVLSKQNADGSWGDTGRCLQPVSQYLNRHRRAAAVCLARPAA
jgi:hypothetical protein